MLNNKYKMRQPVPIGRHQGPVDGASIGPLEDEEQEFDKVTFNKNIA